MLLLCAVGAAGGLDRRRLGLGARFNENAARRTPPRGPGGWAQLLVPAPRAPPLRGLPRGRGRARRGLGAARGAGLSPCAPRRPGLAPKAPRPSRKPARAPCSRRVSALPTLRPGLPRFAAEACGAGGETSFERETGDARVAAVPRAPACGQAREGVSFPRLCLGGSWSGMQPCARQGPSRHPSLHFRPAHSGPAGAFFPTPCPGRLARLPLRPSRRAGSRRARGEQGVCDGSPSALSPEWMRDVINLAAFINSAV